MGGYDPTAVASGLAAATQINTAFPVLDLAIFVTVAVFVILLVVSGIIRLLGGRRR
jgi:hypothetical protein